jgi:hypothetical protein
MQPGGGVNGYANIIEIDFQRKNFGDMTDPEKII